MQVNIWCLLFCVFFKILDFYSRLWSIHTSVYVLTFPSVVLVYVRPDRRQRADHSSRSLVDLAELNRFKGKNVIFL